MQSFFLFNIGYKVSSHILIKRYFCGPKGVKIDFFGRRLYLFIFRCRLLYFPKGRKRACRLKMKFIEDIYTFGYYTQKIN